MPQMYGFDLVINTAITGKLDLTEDQSNHMTDKSCSSVIACSNLWYYTSYIIQAMAINLSKCFIP